MIDTVICGDVFDKLPEIPTGIVHCVVTSPPYWGLRDYGVAGQLGLEKTPEEYIAKMVAVFREVWRVLRDDGTLWLNMGDSYCNDSKWGGASGGKNITSAAGGYPRTPDKPKAGLKHKDLCGIPWRVALALQADGWYLRQDIIWHKPNPMPESVTDRCTKSHEYIFLMTKKARYYYDAEAIKEPSKDPQDDIRRVLKNKGYANKYGQDDMAARSYNRGNVPEEWDGGGTRNKRSVWTVPTCPYPEAHFATFPPALILPCIIAGCPEWVCKKCGEPRRRITEKAQIKRRRKTPTTRPCDDRSPSANDVAGVESKTVGWTDCGCNAGFDGGIVLDPFMGAGTVGAVAYENNRHYIGIELNPDQNIQKRLTDVLDKYPLFPAQTS